MITIIVTGALMIGVMITIYAACSGMRGGFIEGTPVDDFDDVEISGKVDHTKFENGPPEKAADSLYELNNDVTPKQHFGK